MSVLNINSGIHTGVTQAHEKCAMKMKETRKKKNDGRVKLFLLEGGLYKAVTEDWLVRFQ